MERRARCPFNGKACVECAVYRGRHCSSGPPGALGAASGRDPACGSPGGLRASDFQHFEAMRTPRSTFGESEELPVLVKLLDVEEGTSRFCDPSEPLRWDWGNPDLLRLVDGWQVHSFAKLQEILRYKAENGCREVEVKEVPRFMLLAGG
jgi:hypothetical protein